MGNSGIYKITNQQNGKVYIGQSTNVSQRINGHRRRLIRGKHENSYLQHSWDKYGENAFGFDVIELCDIEDLDAKEVFYIDYFHATDERFGYNRETGGSLHKKMSQAAREKMSKAKKGRYDGEKNPMYGVHLKCSEEKKRK